MAMNWNGLLRNPLASPGSGLRYQVHVRYQGLGEGPRWVTEGETSSFDRARRLAKEILQYKEGAFAEIEDTETGARTRVAKPH